LAEVPTPAAASLQLQFREDLEPRFLLPQSWPGSVQSSSERCSYLCLHSEKTSKYHVSREKQYPIEREFLWMFGSERGEVLNSKGNNVLIGPGAYDVKESQRKMLQCSWSKASRFKTSP
jgi:hypothetical protein